MVKYSRVVSCWVFWEVEGGGGWGGRSVMGVEIFGLSVEVWIERKEEEEEKEEEMMMMMTDRWFVSMNVCTYA